VSINSPLSGWLLYAENHSRVLRFTVDADLGESFNLLASRGALATSDALPPQSGQLLQVLLHYPAVHPS